MATFKLTPFRYFLRLYEASIDGRDPSEPNETPPVDFISILRRYKDADLVPLVAEINDVLDRRDESAARMLFNDGHLYIRWQSPQAATNLLKSILSDLKSFRQLLQK